MIEIFSIILVIMFIGIAAHINQWKHYKRVYKLLPTLKYIRIYNYLNGYNEDNGNWTNSNFSWNVDNDTFRVGSMNYLFNSILTFIDPYSLYWFIKFKRYSNKYLYLKFLEQPNSPKSL